MHSTLIAAYVYAAHVVNFKNPFVPLNAQISSKAKTTAVS